MSNLDKIPHAPSDDDEVESYARGVMTGVMHNATPNAVGGLLARIRQLDKELEETADKFSNEAANEIVRLRKRVAELLGQQIDVATIDHDPRPRCRACGWPLAARAEEGCVEGNCSQRSGR